MENKYFIPDISDIRIGYEYEEYHPVWTSEGIDESFWVHKVFKEPLMYGTTISDKIDLRHIRVPFLTKEQIENERWELAEVLEEDDDGNDMFSTGFEKYINEDNWYSFVKKEDNKIIIYKSWYRNSVVRLTRVLFYGKCRCINDFRLIMKMLNIK